MLPQMPPMKPCGHNKPQINRLRGKHKQMPNKQPGKHKRQHKQMQPLPLIKHDKTPLPLPGNNNKPLPGKHSKPLPGKHSKPHYGNNNKPLPGRLNKPLPGKHSNRPYEINKPQTCRPHVTLKLPQMLPQVKCLAIQP
jgi:hypothetical protein